MPPVPSDDLVKEFLKDNQIDLENSSSQQIENLLNKVLSEQLELKNKNEALLSEKVHLETKLSKSMELCKATLLGQLTIDTDGIIQYADEKSTTLFKLSAEKLKGLNLAALIDEKYLDLYRDFWGMFKQNKRTCSCEFKLKGTEGETSYAEIKLSALKPEGEEPAGFNVSLSVCCGKENPKEMLRLQSLILDKINETIVTVDLEGKVIYWSKSAERVYGWAKEEAIGENITELLPILTERHIIDKIVECLYKGETWIGELSVKNKSDRELIISVEDHPYYDPNGNLAGFIGISTDITERKIIQTELDKSEQKYRNVIENAPVGIFQSTVDGHFNMVNMASAHILKFDDPQDAMDYYSKHNIIDYLYVDKNKRREFLNILRKDGVVRNFITRVYTKTGEIRTVSMFAAINKDNTIDGFLEDVTEVVEYREKLLRERELFETIVNRLPVMITRYDPTVNVLFLNSKAEELLGWKTEEMAHINLVEEVYPDPEYRKELEEFMKSASDDWLQVKCRAKSGEIIDSEWSNIRLEDGTQVGIGLDIRDRLERERALKESEQKLREAQQIAQIGNFEFIFSSGRVFCSEQIFEILEKDNYTKPVYFEDFAERINGAEDKDLKSFFYEIARLNESGAEEYTYDKLRGGCKHLTINAKPIADKTNRVVSIIGTIQDISRRKEIELALKKSEQDYKNLFDNAHDAIILFDPTTEIILEANKKAISTYQYPARDFIGMKLTQISKHPVSGKKKIEEIMKRREIDNFETIQFRKDGKELVMEVSASLTKYGGKDVILSLNHDVTEKRLSEAALKESERKYRILIENLPNGAIFLFDNELRYKYVGGKALVHLHAKPEELIGKKMQEVFPDSEWQRMDYENAKLFRGQNIYYEAEYHGYVFANWGVPIRNESGVVTEGLVYSIEITRLRKTENELKKTNDILELTSSMAKIGGWEFDPITMQGTWTSEVARIHDLDPNDPTSVNKGLSFYVGESRKKIDKAIKDAIEQGKSYNLELELISNTGVRKWVHTIGDVIVEKGKVKKVYGSFQDITYQKYIEIALRTSEVRFRAFFDSDVVGTLMGDINGSVNKANRKFLDIIGYTKNELNAGKVRWDKMTPDEYLEIDRQKIKAGQEGNGVVKPYQKRYVRKDGRLIWVLVGYVLIGQKKEDYVAFVLDITENKENEQKLIEQKEYLRNLNIRMERVREDERKNIAREIHDNLGQSLTALKIDLSTLKKNLEAPDKLETKISQMENLINFTVKDVQKLSSRLRPELLDHLGLIAAIDWIAGDFQARTGIECKCLLPEEINLDEEASLAFFRIVQEALTNVARHAMASLVKIELKVSDEKIILQISDNGIGIDKDKLNSHESLGLIGIRERINTIEGTVHIEGEKGKGTTLTIAIPVKPI